MSQDVLLVSSTDTPEAVLSALGEPAKDAVKETSAAPETAAETEGDPESPDREQDPEKPKSKGGFQKRIDKLVAQKAELERQLAEAGKISSTAAKPIETKPVEAAPADGKPKAENFDTYEAYVEALSDWKFDQKEQARSKAETERRQAEAQKTAQDAWQERLKEARSRYEDFDEVLAGSDDVPVSQAMNQAIFESEYGADVVYYLAGNPTEAARIAQLSPSAAARAIGKIEAGLEKAAPKEKPKTSRAPEPIQPVGRKATTSTKPLDQMDFQDYVKAREAQIKRAS
jgi:post-segregation antitoxin (ccd killing protein)